MLPALTRLAIGLAERGLVPRGLVRHGIRNLVRRRLEAERLEPGGSQARNAAFAAWLDRDYHRRVHSSLGVAPIARFLDSKRPKRWISRSEIDLHFYCTLKRKVRSDCTVSVNGTRYEVPAEWIGRAVELRHPVYDPRSLTLFAGGEPTVVLKPLDLEHNDRTNRRASFARRSTP